MPIDHAAQQDADLFLGARHVLTNIVYAHLDNLYTDLGDLLELPAGTTPDPDWRCAATFGVDALVAADNAARRATLVRGRVHSFLVPLLTATGPIASTVEGRSYHVTQEAFSAPRIVPVTSTPTPVGGVRRGD